MPRGETAGAQPAVSVMRARDLSVRRGWRPCCRGRRLLSTLRSFVRATGGDLHLIATYPDAEPVRRMSFIIRIRCRGSVGDGSNSGIRCR